jgi:hypothetical protein
MDDISGQDPARKSRIHRWYDMDVQLSELVLSLEMLSEESQTLFAFLLMLFSDEIVRAKGRAFFQELEWEKIMGIYKSKRGRRWYDRQPVTHKAFNKLYSLSDDNKAIIAQQLYIPVRIVKQYETHCQEQGGTPDINLIFDIVETSFREGPQVAQERYRSL